MWTVIEDIKTLLSARMIAPFFSVKYSNFNENTLTEVIWTNRCFITKKMEYNIEILSLENEEFRYDERVLLSIWCEIVLIFPAI